MTMLLESSN